MLGLDAFLKTLDPASILVGICFGTVLALACTAVGAWLSVPSKAKENKARLDEPVKLTSAVPTVDIGKLKALLAKPKSAMSVIVGSRPPTATVTGQPTLVPVKEAESPVVKPVSHIHTASRRVVNPNLPSYRYQVAGSNETYTSLKAVLTACFPEALKLQPATHLFYDRLPQEVKSKILREKVN